MTSPKREFILTAIGLAVPFGIALLCCRDFEAFPHNDDFLYARCSEILVNEGEVRHVSQQGRLAASVLSHCVWGALFCIPVGFSYDALQFSVVAAAWLGGIAVWSLSRRLEGSASVSFLAALTMSVGPFYFGMSFTFMTDVTATAFVAMALAAYAKGVFEKSTLSLLTGALMASLAVWARQTHLLVILVPFVAILGRRFGRSSTVTHTRSLVELTISVGLPVFAYLLFESGWVVPGNQERMEIVDVTRRDWQWIKQTLLFAYGGGLLLGLVVVPLAPLFLSQWRSGRQIPWIGVLVACLWLVPFAITGGRGYITQATGYILYNAHLGPILLGDQNDPGRWSDIGGVTWPAWIWQTVTLASIVGLATICQVIYRSCLDAWRSRRLTSQSSDFLAFRLGLVIMLLASILSLLWLVEMIYDRYWLLCYPALFALIGGQTLRGWSALQKATVATFLLVWMATSVVLTHDFLAWNNARRIQVERWLEAGLEPKDFDAGNGINGWFRSDEDEQTFGRENDPTPFWRGLASEMLAIGPREGWREVGRVNWDSWAVGAKKTLYVLERVEAVK